MAQQPLDIGQFNVGYILLFLYQVERFYHVPDMQPYRQSEVDKCDRNWDLEFVYEDGDEACLEDICVEEKQKDDNNRKHDAHVLDAL